MEQSEGLKREIGLGGFTANIVNVVIGAGIFVLPAVVSKGLGASGVLAYLFCGVLIAICMLCFAEVGSRITTTGGAYAYIEVAFGKYFGFLTACLLVFGTSLLATAAVANALANTLGSVFPIFFNTAFRIFFFLFIFSALAIVNVKGVKEGILLVKVTTIAKLTPLLLLIILGFGHISSDNLVWSKVPTAESIGSISLILFFAFQGAESSLSIGGELKNPRRNFPRAIGLGFTVVLLVYMGIQFISQGVVGDSLGDFKDAPLAEVARHIFGPTGGTLMILGASVSMFGYLTSDCLNIPRVLFRASIDDVIPVRRLHKIHPKFATPYIAIVGFISLGCLLSITGEFERLAVLSSSASLLIYLGVSLSVIKFRLKNRIDQGAYLIPGGITIPILSVMLILWFLSNLKKEEVTAIVIALAVLSVVYILLRFLKKKTPL
jgi:basic amino acid/polyamine antiporter, APA family